MKLNSIDVAPVSIIDTHTHLLATFEVYKRNFPEGEYNTYHDFVKGFYKPPSTS
jgi:TatD DNase family protein